MFSLMDLKPVWLGPFLNLNFYQVVWALLVFGSASHSWIWGFLAVIVLWIIHLSFFSKQWARDFKTMILCFFLGLMLDTALKQTGFTSFPDDNIDPFAWFVPGWMICLWVAFATVPNYCLDWFRGKHLYSVLFGVIGGPLAYYTGHRVGALEIADPLPLGLLGIGIAWSIVLPVIFLHTSAWEKKQGSD